MPDTLTAAQQAHVYSVLTADTSPGAVEVAEKVARLLATGAIHATEFMDLRSTIQTEMLANRTAAARESAGLREAIVGMGEAMAQEAAAARKQTTLVVLVVTILAMGINAAMIGIGVSVGMGQTRISTTPTVTVPMPMPTPFDIAVPIEVPDANTDAAGMLDASPQPIGIEGAP